MNRLRTLARLSLALGAGSVLAMIAAFLALTDIGHGEPDLALEWTVLRAAAIVIAAFHALALITLLGCARRTRT